MTTNLNTYFVGAGGHDFSKPASITFYFLGVVADNMHSKRNKYEIC